MGVCEDNMDKVTEDEVRQSMKDIVANSHEKALNYAVHYAVVGELMTGHELYVQVLYVLGNMSRWRGDKAREIRGMFKRYVKENK